MKKARNSMRIQTPCWSLVDLGNQFCYFSLEVWQVYKKGAEKEDGTLGTTVNEL